MVLHYRPKYRQSRRSICVRKSTDNKKAIAHWAFRAIMHDKSKRDSFLKSDRFNLNDNGSVEKFHSWIQNSFWRLIDGTDKCLVRNDRLSLETFCWEIMKRLCPGHEEFIEEHVGKFRTYLDNQSSIPMFGAILINRELTKVVLVEHQSSVSSRKGTCGFPKGKQEPGESEHGTAFREVLEETQVDIKHLLHSRTPSVTHRISYRNTFIKLFIVVVEEESLHFTDLKPTQEIVAVRWASIADIENDIKSLQKSHRNAPNYPSQVFQEPFKMLKRWIESEQSSKKLHWLLFTTILIIDLFICYINCKNIQNLLIN